MRGISPPPISSFRFKYFQLSFAWRVELRGWQRRSIQSWIIKILLKWNVKYTMPFLLALSFFFFFLSHLVLYQFAKWWWQGRGGGQGESGGGVGREWRKVGKGYALLSGLEKQCLLSPLQQCTVKQNSALCLHSVLTPLPDALRGIPWPAFQPACPGLPLTSHLPSFSCLHLSDASHAHISSKISV